jgi:dihydrofolate reductase
VRPIIVQEFVSMDGVMQAPGDRSEYVHGGWQRPYICDDLLRLMVKQMTDADALLLGRKTYEAFAAAWPQMTGMLGLADRMNTLPKYVASNTLREVGWNATLISGDIASGIAELKQQAGAGLVVAGSGALVQLLARHDLVDEYRIWVHPVIVGTGERLFREGLDMSLWDLADVTTTSKGAAVLTYKKARAPERTQ